MESDQANRTDVADRGVLRPGCFRCAFVPWGRVGSCTTCRRRRREICFIPFTACFRGPKWPGCERQEVAPQAGNKCALALRLAPLVVCFICCFSGARKAAVLAVSPLPSAVAALRFLLSCASDLPHCFMSQSMSRPLPKKARKNLSYYFFAFELGIVFCCP